MSEILGLVVSAELKHSTRSHYWLIVLRTHKDGKVRCTTWDVNSPEKDDVPKKGEIIRFDTTAKGIRDQRQESFQNIVLPIGAFGRVDKTELPQEILDVLFESPKADPADVKKAFQTIVDKDLYSNELYYKFVGTCLKGHGDAALQSCPAGKQMHHAYQGGFLIHTAEVLTLCKGLVDQFPWPDYINKDVVYAGAALHDLGKLSTYLIDDVGQPGYRPEELLVGHLGVGIDIIKHVARKLKVDDWFEREVSHIVASHHMRKEFGALAEPMTNEAWIVSCADLLGSRAGMIETRIDNIKKGAVPCDEVWGWPGNQFFMTSSLKKVVGNKNG